MGDPAATLRALADACEKCHQFAKLANDVECISAQRITLMRALPDVTGWPATAAELRTMADTVDRLTRERDEARALLATPKPRRDPLTDPRPGDVVRYNAPDMESPITARVTARDTFHVWVTSEHGECRYTIGHWSDWSGITTEVLHTADEVTP